MKYLFVFILVTFSISIAHTQDEHYKNSIGMDVLPSFAVLFNENSNYLEFGYVRELNKLNLRAKFNVNKNSFLNDVILDQRDIDPENNTSYISTYGTRNNLILSLGLAKRFTKGKVNYYFGVDSDWGLNLGESHSSILEENSLENGLFLGRANSTNYSIGITPILGAKIPLMPRVSLELELGVPMLYTFGDVAYFSENTELVNRKIDSREYRFDRLLNDVRISYNF